MSYATEAAIRRKFGNVRQRVGKRGLEYTANCPFCVKRGHSPDTERKLNMNPVRDRYYCHRCSASGMLSRMLGVLPDGGPQMPAPAKELKPVRPPGQLVPLNSLDPACMTRAYIEARGFDANVLYQHFGVAGCVDGFCVSDGEKLWFNATGTIVFPVWMNGTVVGWQARTPYEPKKLTEQECADLGMPIGPKGVHVRPPKYMTPSAMDKSLALFNYDNARRGDAVVLCEGPLDAISAGLCAVASFGKGVSEEQIRLIKSYWKLAIILLDPDADDSSRALESTLRMAMPTLRVSLQGAEDAGDMSFVDLWEQIFRAAHAAQIDLNKYLPPHWHYARARQTTKWVAAPNAGQ